MEENEHDEQPTGSERSEGTRVDIESPRERRMWARRLGCSEEELRHAVQEVGPLVEDVKLRLDK